MIFSKQQISYKWFWILSCGQQQRIHCFNNSWHYPRSLSKINSRGAIIMAKLLDSNSHFRTSRPWLVVTFRPKKSNLTQKPRSREVPTHYEAILLWFRLINWRDMWKLTFFSLIWPLNDFKVKYVSIEVKKCQQTKFEVNGVTEWDFMGVRKH